MEKDPFVFDYRFLSNQWSHRKLKEGFKTLNELPSMNNHCLFIEICSSCRINLKIQLKKGFWWFLGKSTAGSKMLRKPIMLSVTFTVQYVDKNLTKGQLNSASRFFVWLDWNFEKNKDQVFCSDKLIIFKKGQKKFSRAFSTFLLQIVHKFQKKKNKKNNK